MQKYTNIHLTEVHKLTSVWQRDRQTNKQTECVPRSTPRHERRQTQHPKLPGFETDWTHRLVMFPKPAAAEHVAFLLSTVH